MNPSTRRSLTPFLLSLTTRPNYHQHHHHHHHYRAFTTTPIPRKSNMPPPPPNPPLSYTTSSALNPYLVPYHPLNPSATTDPRDLVTHRLAVGAAVLNLSSTPHRILVLQRSAKEKALPHCWEVPGGAAESVDGNLVASSMRELWEETGLRAARVKGLVGSYKWSGFGPSVDAPAVPGDQALALPGGGVGIAGEPSDAGVETTAAAGGGGAEERSPEAAKGRDAWRKFTYLVEVEANGEDGEPKVLIDPEEHDAFVWATEEEVRADRAGDVKFKWTSEHQKRDLLKALEMAKKL
ncbi:nudix domain protein [Colletotrichum truncatum]|uniref:Nudix domain protein n=1 Tax=Colletotrichum truncatum TaxID=5467 RepID=A0ACC3Z148_COLTU|nr:nudix domain protein [Colletotrichum truncatum]KAF6800434.1 nudix domain protein [Colletotrichum truncatum]